LIKVKAQVRVPRPLGIVLRDRSRGKKKVKTR
jgi:hypothetical protein